MTLIWGLIFFFCAGITLIQLLIVYFKYVKCSQCKLVYNRYKYDFIRVGRERPPLRIENGMARYPMFNCSSCPKCKNVDEFVQIFGVSEPEELRECPMHRNECSLCGNSGYVSKKNFMV